MLAMFANFCHINSVIIVAFKPAEWHCHAHSYKDVNTANSHNLAQIGYNHLLLQFQTIQSLLPASLGTRVL